MGIEVLDTELDVKERDQELEDSNSCDSDNFGSICDEGKTMNE